MAGLFPSIGNSQNFDLNGTPYAFSVLSVYQGGTLTLANCFQDIGLVVPAQNPMTALEDSRLPLFYVADGVYSVRLVDQFGVQIYYLAQIASIGASSSGGGGAAVDPTAIYQTGDPLWVPIDGTRSGWIRLNGRTFGSATSGGTERANADTQPLYLFAWNTYPDAFCPVSGGRGVSAAADFAANKPIGSLNMQGKAAFGLDTMGAAAANILTLANLGAGHDPTIAATAIGSQNHTLLIAEIPSITPAGSVAIDDARTFQIVVGGTGVGGSTNVVLPSNVGSGTGESISIGGSITGSFTGTAFGGGGPHNVTSPGRVGTWYWKL